MKLLQKLLPFVILIGLSYWAIKPLLLPGFFPMHDDAQVARVYEMHKSLSDGMFPVRWVSDLGYGYGYPIFNFYAPLAYYLGGLMAFFFDALTATKIMMIIAIIGSGITMYLFAKSFWGRWGGLVSALLYVYVPYHAVNIYVRGDVTEFFAYSFIPLAFWGVSQIAQTLHNKKTTKKTLWKWIAVSAIGYAGIIISHNLTAMMATPFLFAFACLLVFQVKTAERYLIFASLGLGILLASFYWLPVFAEMKYTDVLSQVGGGAAYKEHFVCPQQLWNSAWGFGGSTPNSCIDGVSYKIGKLHIGLAIIALFALFFSWKKDKRLFSILSFCVLSLSFSLFLMLNSSQFLWDALSPMAFFQYPWRFLLIVSFFISFLGGAVLWMFKNFPFVEPLLGSVLLIAIIFVNAELFVPQVQLAKTANDYTKPSIIKWDTSKISDEYLPNGFAESKSIREIVVDKITLPSSDGKITVIQQTGMITAQIFLKKAKKILIKQAYFPAWHVFVDGKETSYTKAKNGMIVAVPVGTHFIELRFIQTPIERLGNALSLTGVLVLFLGIMSTRKDKIHDKKST